MNARELYDASNLKYLAERGRSLPGALETSYARSRLRRCMDQFGHFARQSFLAQWLLAEPGPDVIVIDLRETVIVSPFLAVRDRLGSLAVGSWYGSRIRPLTRHPVRLLSAVLVVSLAVNTVFSLVIEALSPVELGVRVVLLAVALGGTQMRHTWDDVTETRVYTLATALLGPLEVSAEEDDR